MELVNTHRFQVRFSEVDAMQVVWHGNYLKYFEDGREAFGAQYGLKYLDVHQHGFFTPIVKTNVEYKYPLRYGDEGQVETRFINTRAAKIVFEYKVYNLKTKQLLVTGQTTQVFLTTDHQLQLVNPGFYIAWKEKWEQEY